MARACGNLCWHLSQASCSPPILPPRGIDCMPPLLDTFDYESRLHQLRQVTNAMKPQKLAIWSEFRDAGPACQPEFGIPSTPWLRAYPLVTTMFRRRPSVSRPARRGRQCAGDVMDARRLEGFGERDGEQSSGQAVRQPHVPSRVAAEGRWDGAPYQTKAARPRHICARLSASWSCTASAQPRRIVPHTNHCANPCSVESASTGGQLGLSPKNIAYHVIARGAGYSHISPSITWRTSPTTLRPC